TRSTPLFLISGRSAARAGTAAASAPSTPSPAAARHRLLIASLPSLHEGHLVDLAEGGGAGEDLLEGGIAQEGHALLPRRLLDLRRRPALEHHLPDAVGHV